MLLGGGGVKHEALPYKTICINKHNDCSHIAAWNVLSLFLKKGLSQMKLEFEKYNIVTAAVQETE
jgi:hypothetical protein